jgi:hypothetical protein
MLNAMLGCKVVPRLPGDRDRPWSSWMVELPVASPCSNVSPSLRFDERDRLPHLDQSGEDVVS